MTFFPIDLFIGFILGAVAFGWSRIPRAMDADQLARELEAVACSDAYAAARKRGDNDATWLVLAKGLIRKRGRSLYALGAGRAPGLRGVNDELRAKLGRVIVIDAEHESGKVVSFRLERSRDFPLTEMGGEPPRSA